MNWKFGNLEVKEFARGHIAYKMTEHGKHGFNCWFGELYTSDCLVGGGWEMGVTEYWYL